VCAAAVIFSTTIAMVNMFRAINPITIITYFYMDGADNCTAKRALLQFIKCKNIAAYRALARMLQTNNFTAI